MKDKTVLLVDDMETVIDVFHPLLVKETDGKAKFICHRGESAAELADLIFKLNPDLVLLDFNLAGGIKGAAVGKELVGRGFGGVVVGFSTVDAAEDFKAAGVTYFVPKSIHQPERSVGELKRLVTGFSANSILCPTKK